MRTVSFTLNGKPAQVTTDEARLLLWVLRDDLNLTGTKYGCGQATCGSCAVVIDKASVRACSTRLADVEGKSVTTIEGLEQNGKLHPVQQAVVDEQGFQCAFCMSGFIMATVGYLKTNPKPTRTELAQGISGNLCRCCDYNKILRSMMKATEYMEAGRV